MGEALTVAGYLLIASCVFSICFAGWATLRAWRYGRFRDDN